MRRTIAIGVVWLAGLVSDAGAQTFPVRDPVLERLWRIGMDSSRVAELAQVLSDSLGPRLTGSPQLRSAQQWMVARYRDWGITVREERYGTWKGWRRGYTHVDLIAPRVRTLEATMLAFSAGTTRPVQGSVVAIPMVSSRAELTRWLPSARGKFVLASEGEATCRPDESFARWGTAEVRVRVARERDSVQRAWATRLRVTGLDARGLHRALDSAGVAGIVVQRWSEGWGADRVFDATAERAPTIQLRCEDFGLVERLARLGQGPRLRVDARSQALGEVPVYNVVAEIRGREKPDEYVLLSAHFDTWDGASGTTDNGTGTVIMMEAMRLLGAALPTPKRTILVGHWAGEEQGLNGSRAFAQDHPEVVRGLQVMLNQDNGTGPVTEISMTGFTDAGAFFARWLARIPVELSRDVKLELAGAPGRAGSDHASFLCHGAPAFRLQAEDYDYQRYTWHTTLDTYDKMVVEHVRRNAVLTAMLAYLASEDPETVSRARRVIASANGGEDDAWPTCRAPRRNSSQPRQP